MVIERLLPAGAGRRVRVRCSARTDGDFHVDGPAVELAARRQGLVAGEWTWLHQVHGATVVAVDRPGAGAGSSADGAVTTVIGAVLAAHTADCAPVVLVGEGVVGVAHVGWRGIVAGVIPAVVAAMRRGDGPIRRETAELTAVLGPCIRAAHYEFGSADLATVEEVAGPRCRGITADGRPALDLAGAVDAVLAEAGVTEFVDLGIDTAAPEWFSHRMRRDVERQATVAVLEEA